MLKVLGVIDIVSALLLLLMSIGLRLPAFILVIFAVLLILKSGMGLFKDIASWFDMLGAIMFILSIFVPVFKILLVISAILLFQKGALSFLS